MPDKSILDDKRLTAKEVAELLGVNRETIYRWARTRQIPCARFGRRRLRFKLSDIERWEKQHTTGKF